MKKTYRAIALVEPLAHSDGHYYHFLKKIHVALSHSESDVNVYVSFFSKEQNEIPFSFIETASKGWLDAFSTFLSYIVSAEIKRLLIFDILSVQALRKAAKENSTIVFLSTFYFIPYIYSQIFLKNKKVVFYRFSQPGLHSAVIGKIISFFSSKQAKNIYFQSRAVVEEFSKVTGSTPNYLPIPIIAQPINNLARDDKKRINILLFGINHINKDIYTLVQAIKLLKKQAPEIAKKLDITVAGVQQSGKGRITGEEIKAELNCVKCINEVISDKEKIRLFSEASYVFAGFKKSFHSSSGVLTDCLEYDVPFICSTHQELAVEKVSCTHSIFYESENAKDLFEKLRETVMMKDFISPRKQTIKCLPEFELKNFLKMVL